MCSSTIVTNAFLLHFLKNTMENALEHSFILICKMLLGNYHYLSLLLHGVLVLLGTILTTCPSQFLDGRVIFVEVAKRRSELRRGPNHNNRRQ